MKDVFDTLATLALIAIGCYTIQIMLKQQKSGCGCGDKKPTKVEPPATCRGAGGIGFNGKKSINAAI